MSLPAARCQPGRRRRKPAANWNAPSTPNTAAVTMCTTTGSGATATRVVSSVISATPASERRRKKPTISGGVQSAIRAT